MGSITTYEVHIHDNHCKITFECEGDMGDCDDGIELEFQLDEFLQKEFKLKDNQRITWSQISQLRPFIAYKNYLLQKGII